MHFRESNFQKFSGGACPRTPLEARSFGPSVCRAARLLYHENPPTSKINENPASLRKFTSIPADPLWKSTALDQKPITEASTDTVPVLAKFLLKRGSSFASYTTHSYRSLRLRNISTVFINNSHSRFRLLWLVTILPLILTLIIFGKRENSCLGTRLVAQKWTSAFFSIGIILHIILSIIQ